MKWIKEKISGTPVYWASAGEVDFVIFKVQCPDGHFWEVRNSLDDRYRWARTLREAKEWVSDSGGCSKEPEGAAG